MFHNPSSLFFSLSAFIQYELRVCTVAAVFTDQNEILAGYYAVAALISGSFNLISEINVVFIQKPDLLPVGQSVFKIHAGTAQQIEIVDGQSINSQAIDFSDQTMLQLRKIRVPFGDAAASEGMPSAFFTTSAL